MKKGKPNTDSKVSSINEHQNPSIALQSKKSVSKASNKIYSGESNKVISFHSQTKKSRKPSSRLRKRSFSESRSLQRETQKHELPSLISFEQVFLKKVIPQEELEVGVLVPKKTMKTVTSMKKHGKSKRMNISSGMTIKGEIGAKKKKSLKIQTKRKLFKKRRLLWENLGNKDTTVKHLLSNLEMEELTEEEKIRIQKRKIRKSYLSKNKLAKHVFKKVAIFDDMDSEEDEKLLNIPKSFILGPDNMIENQNEKDLGREVSVSLEAPPNSQEKIIYTKKQFREKKLWKKARDRLIDSNKKKKRRKPKNKKSTSLGNINLKGVYELIDLSFKNINDKTHKNLSD
jgi:hypothetical protein